MPPKFLSSNISKTWADRVEPPGPSKKRTKRSNSVELSGAVVDDEALSRITAQQLLDLGAVDRFSERTTKQLLAEAPTLKRKKVVNYKVFQEQMKEAKKQDLEQRKRDEEIAGGGKAIIVRTRNKKKERKRGPSLHTDGDSRFRDGVLFVPKKVINETTSKTKTTMAMKKGNRGKR